MNGYWIYWVIAAIVFLLIELAHYSFIIFWFTIGALVAAIVSVFIASFNVQIIVFLVVSALLAMFAGPIVRHIIFRSAKSSGSNIDNLIGRIELCIEDIDNVAITGKVKVFGSTWKALSSKDDVKIKEGQRVRVKDVQGLKLIVEPVDNNL